MIQLRPQPVTVAVHHEEPLLAMGLRSALQCVPQLRLLTPDADAAGPSAQVLVTDWAQGMRSVAMASSDPRKPHRVLVILTQTREQPLLYGLRRGLGGVILASCAEAELLRAIDALAAGRSYVCAELAQRVAATMSREPLTSREETVLQLVARGHCNKAIATSLGIAPGTVKSHVKAILAKLAASTRTEAASIATELGMIEYARTPRLDLAAMN